MNWLHNIIPNHIIYALGWTVVHSLWQGVVIAALMTLVLMFLKNKTAQARYWVSNVALLAMLISSIITFQVIAQNLVAYQSNAANMTLILRGQSFLQTIDNQGFVSDITWFFNRYLSLVVVAWLMGVLFFLAKLSGSLMYVEILKNRHVIPLADEWVQMVELLKSALKIKQKVALLESSLITSPMTLGWLKPIILMPVGIVNSLSPAQVEAILAHELAHIKGRDYIINIVQSFIEILYYYHPAVWWISSNIRIERENRCDDMAVNLTGNSLTYAKALLIIQELNHSKSNTYALAMGFSTQPKGLLLNRIKRILNQQKNRNNVMEKFFATTVLIVAMTIVACKQNFQNSRRDTQSSFFGKIELTEKNGIYSIYEDGKEKPLDNSNTEGVEKLKKGMQLLTEIIDGEKPAAYNATVYDRDGNQTIMLNHKIELRNKSGKNFLTVDEKSISLEHLNKNEENALWDGMDQIGDIFFPEEDSRKTNKYCNIITQNLLKDNLIKGKYEVQINNNKMLVNKVEMTKDIKDRYVGLCQDFENKQDIGFYVWGDLDLKK
jgi:beta-lactamase regulating signal transducer with metallopeptidase domain